DLSRQTYKGKGPRGAGASCELAPQSTYGRQTSRRSRGARSHESGSVARAVASRDAWVPTLSFVRDDVCDDSCDDSCMTIFVRFLLTRFSAIVALTRPVRSDTHPDALPGPRVRRESQLD